MKKSFAVLLAALLLCCAGCTAGNAASGPQSSEPSGVAAVPPDAPTLTGGLSGEQPMDITCVAPMWWDLKIIEVYENSALVTNGEAEDGPGLSVMTIRDGAVYREGEQGVLPTDALRPGMVVRVLGGPVDLSYPAGFITGSVEILGEGDDRIGLYRQVIADLWEDDPGLNGGVEILGFDFSNACLLPSERQALEYLAARDLGLGMSYVVGTWSELAEQGYIDREHLIWDNGLFFSIQVTGEPGSPGFTFDAQKWRSGLGAIFYEDCTAERERDGSWSYTVGQFAIS